MATDLNFTFQISDILQLKSTISLFHLVSFPNLKKHDRNENDQNMMFLIYYFILFFVKLYNLVYDLTPAIRVKIILHSIEFDFYLTQIQSK